MRPFLLRFRVLLLKFNATVYGSQVIDQLIYRVVGLSRFNCRYLLRSDICDALNSILAELLSFSDQLQLLPDHASDLQQLLVCTCHMF